MDYQQLFNVEVSCGRNNQDVALDVLPFVVFWRKGENVRLDQMQHLAVCRFLSGDASSCVALVLSYSSFLGARTGFSWTLHSNPLRQGQVVRVSAALEGHMLSVFKNVEDLLSVRAVKK